MTKPEVDDHLHDLVRSEHDGTFAAGAVFGGVVAGLLLLAMAMMGCASPAGRVLASTNAYEFNTARTKEECPAPPSDPCKAKNAWLRKWSGALDEAAAALKRTGAMPLQLKRLADTEKEKP
jgi:hypothetical protein